MSGYTETREQVIAALHSDSTHGLTDETVTQSRQQNGANQLTPRQGISMPVRFWHALCEPMMLLLLAAAIITFGVNLAKLYTGGEPDFIECFGIVIAIGLAVTITVVMEGRSQAAFDALSKMQDNLAVRTVRNGEQIILTQQALVVGDIILLETGDKTPADCRLLNASELTVDESALTGESKPVRKNADTVFSTSDIPLAERENMLYSGCYVTTGMCTAIVTAVGDHTEIGQIASELGESHQPATPLQQKLKRLGKTITLLGIFAAALVFVIQLVKLINTGPVSYTGIGEILITSIVLIVAAVPEGLPTIVAMSLALNVIKMARENALVKKMIACETAGCVNVICSDKTGTLTQNRMTVAGFFDGQWHDSAADIISPYLTHNICLNTTASLGENGFIGNPTECALLAAYESSIARSQTGKTYLDERNDHDILHVFPFSSDLKHMTTISRVDGAVISYVKGSPEQIISMCSLSQEQVQAINAQLAQAQAQAMRVIAFAHKQVPERPDYSGDNLHDSLETNMTFDGFVAISDPLRPEVYDAVDTCRSAGISLKILTGDHINTARAIAGQLHILKDDSLVVTAAEVMDMSDTELESCLDRIAVIARSTPALKLRIVKMLMNQGNVVAVTGDGVNDAPAIKYADVGVAMGITGTDVSKEAADIVLLDDSFATIAKSVRWGRGIYKNFQRFITFQLTVNLSAVLTVLCSIIAGFISPFSALQLLWINIIMDGPPALTLGLEPLRENLMTEKPVDRTSSIVTVNMLRKIIICGLWVSAMFMLQTGYNVLGGTPEEQSTILFTMFVLFQLFNAFNCREMDNASMFPQLKNNKIMLWVFAATFALQVLITQFGGEVFDTVPLPLDMWVKIVLYSLSVIVVAELIKLILRQVSPQTVPADMT